MLSNLRASLAKKLSITCAHLGPGGGGEGEAEGGGGGDDERAGTQFTRVTSTKVQILTPAELFVLLVQKYKC